MHSSKVASIEDCCRIGDYRQAFFLSKRRREHGLADGEKLAFILLKLKRYKLSILLALESLSNHSDSEGNCVSIVAQCLKRIRPNRHLFDTFFPRFDAIRLEPRAIALIVSSIQDEDIRKHFLNLYSKVHSCLDCDCRLREAYTAFFDGMHTHALSIAQDLVNSNIQNTEASNLAADILLQNNYPYHARRYACLSLKHKPYDISALTFLALSLNQEARWKATRRVFQILHSINNDDLSLINSLIALPTIALAANDLSEAIQGFQALEELYESNSALMGIEESLKLCTATLPSEFYLPYEGPVSVKKNLELARSFIRLSAQPLIDCIKSHYTASPCKVPKTALATQSYGKIKIGFISRFFNFHSNLEAHYGLITNLDKSRFHVVVIHRAGSVVDAEQVKLNDAVDQVLYLEDDFGDSCRVIHELDLDILFFTDVGMCPLDYVIAMPHLARKQFTSWGLPHTTGVKEIDYYLRSQIFSDCEDQSEYTEQLVETQGYFGYFDYCKYKLNNLSRDYFLLPPDRFLVGCLQSLHKIHPDFDIYLEHIALIDESILIVICPSSHDLIMHRFIERIKKSAPTAYRQLCILQRSSLDDFYSLNNLLDLNLDTINYGAGVTFVQTTWCGPPYVTEFRNLLRSSVVSRSYQFAGISNPPIAYDRNQYIDLVKKYFNDRESLAALRDEIQLKSRGTIYNNEAYLRSCEKAFLAPFDS